LPDPALAVFLQYLIQLFNTPGGFGLRQLEHQHQKLIAAPPKQHVVRTHERTCCTRYRTDSFVAHSVAQCIVDRFQVVDVEHGDAS